MKLSEMDDLQARIAEIASEERRNKGQDYAEGPSGGQDTLWNFKAIGEVCQVLRVCELDPPFQTWFVYFMKHVITLLTAAKGYTLKSESLESRAADMHNYIDLMVGLIKDKGLIAQKEIRGVSIYEPPDPDGTR